ncbi:MAG: hypothetical protein ABJC13_11425 [Acidobacteriota bacterium]
MDKAADPLERLVASLLHEGYALYPYTPGATKNSTPTPFGILYPPAYAVRERTTFDHLQIECILVAPADAPVEANALFLQASGPRHQAVERRIDLAPTPVAEIAAKAVERTFVGPSESDAGVTGRVVLSAVLLAPTPGFESGIWRLNLRIENTTALSDLEAVAFDRAAALRRSFLSTHALLRIGVRTGGGGRFISPVEREGEFAPDIAACRNVNTWPVLGTPEDDAILGAAIFLPDHPQMAPESHLNLFDNTEIEEALLLHVHALSDGEREAISEQDPAVREMIARALATGPAEILSLHGRMTLKDPEPGAVLNESSAGPPIGFPFQDEIPGEQRIEVEGVVYLRGGKVILRPGEKGNPHDKMLHGRIATLERIFIGYDDRVYLGITVDDDPGQDLLRESGRYLYFFVHEVEVL